MTKEGPVLPGHRSGLDWILALELGQTGCPTPARMFVCFVNLSEPQASARGQSDGRSLGQLVAFIPQIGFLSLRFNLNRNMILT